jgi:hypothetical protein
VVGNRDGTLACEPPPREPPPLPEGTFTDSCSGCALETEGGVLRCEQCKGGDGRLHASMLPVGTCGSDEVVANHDGALGCERRGGGGQEASRRHEQRTRHAAATQPNAPDIPNGTYTASCEGCALVNEQARLPVRAHLSGREP